MNKIRLHSFHYVRNFAAGLVATAIMGSSISRATTDTWTGAGTDDNWTTLGNFTFSPTGPTTPATGDTVTFQGTTAPATSNDNETAGFGVAGINFSSGAQAYTVTGNSINLSGTSTDSSTNTETINNVLATANSTTINVAVAGGNLVLGGGLTTSAAGTTSISNSATTGLTNSISIAGITSTATQAVTFTTARTTDTFNVTISGNINGASGNQNFNFNQAGSVTVSSINETSGTTNWNFSDTGTNTISGTIANSTASKGPSFNLDGTGSSAITTTSTATVSASNGFIVYTVNGAETDSINGAQTTTGTGDIIITIGSAAASVASSPAVLYSGVFTLAGSNSFQGTGTGVPSTSGLTANSITVRSGTLSIGITDADATHGALGGASSKASVLIGDTAGSASASLLIAGGYTMATPFTVQAGNSGTTTIGGSNTGGTTANFTGNIAVNKAVTLQAATGGTVDFKTGTWTTNNNAFTVGSTGNAGTVEVENALTTSGGVSVVNGTLLLGNTANVTGSTLAVGTSGTLSSNGSGNVTGNVTVTGSGAINLNSASAISGTLGVTGGNWNGAGSVSGAVTSSSGTLNLGTGANLTANGGLSVTGGTISSTDATGTITGNVSYSSTSTSTFQGAIAGSTKTLTVSAGKLSLTNAGGSSYGGGTTVTGGALYVNNSTGGTSGTGSGAVGVSGTGVLGGSGIITGVVTVSSGGNLYSGGVASGTPTTGTGTGLKLSSQLNVNGASLTFALSNTATSTYASPATSTTYLNLGTTGTISFTGSDTINLVDLTSGGLSLRMNQPYLLISANSASMFSGLVVKNSLGQIGLSDNGFQGTVLGVWAGGSNPLSDYTAITINELAADGSTSLADATTADPGYYQPSLYLSGGDLEVVPEPGTWALMIGGLALLVVIQRRRRQN